MVRLIVFKGKTCELNPEFRFPSNYIHEIQKYAEIFVKFTI